MRFARRAKSRSALAPGTALQQLAESVLLASSAQVKPALHCHGPLLARIQLPTLSPSIFRSRRLARWYFALLTTLVTLVCGLPPAVQSVKESIAPNSSASVYVCAEILSTQIATPVSSPPAFCFCVNLSMSYASPASTCCTAARTELPPAATRTQGDLYR